MSGLILFTQLKAWQLGVGGQALHQHVLLKWSWEAEGKPPGLFYTGASRAKDITAMALAGPMCVRDAQSIGLSPPIAFAL